MEYTYTKNAFAYLKFKNLTGILFFVFYLLDLATLDKGLKSPNQESGYLGSVLSLPLALESGASYPPSLGRPFIIHKTRGFHSSSIYPEMWILLLFQPLGLEIPFKQVHLSDLLSSREC